VDCNGINYIVVLYWKNTRHSWRETICCI